MPYWSVDVPQASDWQPWEALADFNTREEAIQYVMERFGGDEEGRISLVTGPHESPEDQWDESLDEE